MSQLKERKELEKKAMQFGYNGLFATPDTRQEASDYIDRARGMGDTLGTLIGLAMIQNFNAIEKAKELK